MFFWADTNPNACRCSVVQVLGSLEQTCTELSELLTKYACSSTLEQDIQNLRFCTACPQHNHLMTVRRAHKYAAICMQQQHAVCTFIDAIITLVCII